MIKPNVLFLKIMMMAMFSFPWPVRVLSPHLALRHVFLKKLVLFKNTPCPLPRHAPQIPLMWNSFSFFSSGASPQERGPQKKSFQCFSQITVVKYKSASHQCVIYNDLVEG